MLNEIAAAEREPATSEVEQRQSLDSLREDRSRDLWLACEGNGRLVGYADIGNIAARSCAELTFATHPQATNSIRQILLDHAVRQVRERGARALLTYAASGDSSTFFMQNDFTSVPGYRRMTTQLRKAPAPPRWPAGFTLRTYEQVPRPDLIAEASHRCYNGLWGHKPASRDVIHLILTSFAHDGIFLLFDPERRLMGCCKACDLGTPAGAGDEPSGYLDAPGVAEPLRGSGLHENLALAGLEWLHRRGHKRVLLESWGDSKTTIAEYEAAGFQREIESPAFALHLAHG